jgi:hypothetical protein
MTYCKPEWTPVTTELNWVRRRTRSYVSDDGRLFVLGPGFPLSDEIDVIIEGEYVHLTAKPRPLDVRPAEYDQP